MLAQSLRTYFLSIIKKNQIRGQVPTSTLTSKMIGSFNWMKKGVWLVQR